MWWRGCGVPCAWVAAARGSGVSNVPVVCRLRIRLEGVVHCAHNALQTLRGHLGCTCMLRELFIELLRRQVPSFGEGGCQG